MRLLSTTTLVWQHLFWQKTESTSLKHHPFHGIINKTGGGCIYKKRCKRDYSKTGNKHSDGYEYVTSLLLLQQDTAPFVFKTVNGITAGIYLLPAVKRYAYSC